MSDPVADLLRQKGVSYIPSGKDYLTKCFNPDHIDSNPSFRIDRTTGICHCFSCGFKCNLFKFYGILTNNVSIKIAKLKDKLQALKEEANGLEPLKGTVPYPKPYRGISKSTLQKFGAFTTDAVEDMRDRICFPLKDVRDKTMAYIGRSIHSDSGQRYSNYPSGASLPLYPSKLEGNPRNMILVEGLFDWLNCYDKGLTNVVACFGTSKLYKDAAVKLQAYKVMGVEKIFLMYDADTAGIEAMTKLKPILEECEFVVEVISLPEGSDPGDLTQDYIDSIKEYTK